MAKRYRIAIPGEATTAEFDRWSRAAALANVELEKWTVRVLNEAAARVDREAERALRPRPQPPPPALVADAPPPAERTERRPLRCDWCGEDLPAVGSGSPGRPRLYCDPKTTGRWCRKAASRARRAAKRARAK